MLKILRFETQVCLTMSKSSYVDLHFSITFLKSLSCEIQVWFIVSKILWWERITILSHKFVVFVSWIINLYRSAEEIERWSTFMSHSVNLFGMWITVFLSRCQKELEIWIKSLSHSVETFDKWNTTRLAMSKCLWGGYNFCITMIKTFRGELQVCLAMSKILGFELEFCLTMLKLLRFEIHICLTMSKSLLVDLLFCITFLKRLKSEIQFWLTVSKILWRDTIRSLSDSVVKFVISFTISCHSAKNFEIRITKLSHNAAIFEVWNTC